MEGGGDIRCSVKNNQQNQQNSTSLLLLTITAQVVLQIMRSSVILEVVSKVEIVAQAEVFVADSINVICVTNACDFLSASQGLIGGASAIVGWQMAVCCGFYCCVLWCGGCVVHAGKTNATVRSHICSLYQMCASFANVKLAKALHKNVQSFCVARFHATQMHSV